MNVNEIRAIAREREIKTGKMTKGELIRAIQADEGNCGCFGALANGHCDQVDCLWRADCG